MTLGIIPDFFLNLGSSSGGRRLIFRGKLLLNTIIEIGPRQWQTP
jgi:hypothetical protein